MKPAYVVLLALGAGLFGGVAGTTIALRWHEGKLPDTIRARSYELVDERSKVISYWGVDNQRQVTLSFGSRGFALNGVEPHAQPPGLRTHGNQLMSVGLQANDSPILEMNAADGKRRVLFVLSQDGKPSLNMSDELGPGLSLGNEPSDTPSAEDHDWTLVFPYERARLGMFTDIKDGKAYARGALLVNRDSYLRPR